MKKLLIAIIIGTLLFNSCRSKKDDYTLYVKFNRSLDQYYFESAVRSDTVAIGKVLSKDNFINLEQNMPLSILKLSLNQPIPINSEIEFEESDYLNNARVSIRKSSENEVYKSGDTLIGIFKELPKVIKTTNADSLINLVDTTVKELFQLDNKSENR